MKCKETSDSLDSHLSCSRVKKKRWIEEETSIVTSDSCKAFVQSRQRPLSEEHARFYTASVVLGLEYMQQRNLMWRWDPSTALFPAMTGQQVPDLSFRKDQVCFLCPCRAGT